MNKRKQKRGLEVLEVFFLLSAKGARSVHMPIPRCAHMPTYRSTFMPVHTPAHISMPMPAYMPAHVPARM